MQDARATEINFDLKEKGRGVLKCAFCRHGDPRDLVKNHIFVIFTCVF